MEIRIKQLKQGERNNILKTVCHHSQTSKQLRQQLFTNIENEQMKQTTEQLKTKLDFSAKCHIDIY